jgi:plasmid replication initiation protein
MLHGQIYYLDGQIYYYKRTDLLLKRTNFTYVRFYSYIALKISLMSLSPKLYQSNKITEARYDFSLVEKRCLYLIIREVRKRYIETDTGDKNLFDNLVLYFKPEDLEPVISGEKNNSKIYKALKSLNQKNIQVETKENWITMVFINYAEHKKGSHIEIEVSRKLLPLLVNLANNYTAYSLNVALSLKSEYSQRFYEICSQWKNAGGFKIDVEELKERFGISDKYKEFKDFRKRVLEPAKKELKDLFDKGECDLYFNYSEIKQGRKITTISFKIVVGEQKIEDIKEVYYFVAKELYSLFEVLKKPANKDFVELCLNKMHLEPELMKHVQNKINYANKMQYPLEVKIPYIRHILNEDIIGADMEKLKEKREKEAQYKLKQANKKLKEKQSKNEDGFKSFQTLFD